MNHPCPRCSTANPDGARYCRQCGLPLLAGSAGFLGAGWVRHSSPLPAPEGFEPFESGADLYVRAEAAWGGAVLVGTEGLTVTVFNGGYALAQVTVRLRGEDEAGGAVFALEREITAWPRGAAVKLEVASWELPGPAAKLRASLVAAEFGPEK
jgi:hypothetical protein